MFSDLLCKDSLECQIIESIKKCIMTNFRGDSLKRRVCWWFFHLQRITVAIMIFAIATLIPLALCWSTCNSHDACERKVAFLFIKGNTRNREVQWKDCNQSVTPNYWLIISWSWWSRAREKLSLISTGNFAMFLEYTGRLGLITK